MFDISFSELIVIAVIALLVIGPEKLPKVARTLGALTGRMQKYVAQIKDEVNREVRFQELQQLQQEIQSATFSTKEAIQSSLNDVKANIPFETEEFQLTAQDPSPSANPVTQTQTKRAKRKPVKPESDALPLKVNKVAVKKTAAQKTTAQKTAVQKTRIPKAPKET